jgi:hypothetical protein
MRAAAVGSEAVGQLLCWDAGRIKSVTVGAQQRDRIERIDRKEIAHKMGSRKKKRKQQKLLAPLKTRLTQQGLLSDRQVVLQPSREIKMSAVLLDFIAPYAEQWETEEELRKLLSLAVVAWNAALVSGSHRRAFIESVLEVVPPRVHQEMRALLEEMIRRKEHHFASHQRMIVDFHVTMTREGPHVSVASTLSGR